MIIRAIGPLLCGGLLALATMTGAYAQSTKSGCVANLAAGDFLTLRPGARIKGKGEACPPSRKRTTVKSSKSNTSDRMGGGGGKGSAGKPISDQAAGGILTKKKN